MKCGRPDLILDAAFTPGLARAYPVAGGHFG